MCPSRREEDEIWSIVTVGTWEWGWAGLERSQVKISPEEWPQRRTVWSAERVRAVTGPLWEAGDISTCFGVKGGGGPFVPTLMTCLRFCLKSNTRTKPFDVPIATTPED